MDIAANILKLKSQLPVGVELVAVSKFKAAPLILEAYNAGQKIFGESRVKEFLEKQETLPKDISWHFIGHLQTNKVRPLIGKTSLIESVDSEKLIELLDIESLRAGITTDVLLQVHVAQEETKFGFFPEEILEYYRSKRVQNLRAVKIRGIMGMASNTSDTERIKQDFNKIYSIFCQLKNEFNLPQKEFDKVSMGMSGDWELAVESGSNIIRIGSAIFGNR